MKSIHIFKTGTHTDSGGTTLDFDEGLLNTAAAEYDPALHEAPIVIGHPKSDHPAYGWIKSLHFEEGNLSAEPHQVNADFEEMVQSGAFKKVSASWYLPDSPQNPKQGVLYLRHVGFLGAQPPAIKGLQGVDFNEAEEGIIEFEEDLQDGWNLQSISGVFKRFREFLIDKFSREEADNIVPDYVIDELTRSAEKKLTTNQPTPQFEETSMTLQEQLDAANAKNKELADELTTANGKIDALQAQVASFQEQETKRHKETIASKIDALIAEGKANAQERDTLIQFAELLDSTGKTLEFGEGDEKQEVQGSQALIDMLAKRPSAVDFNEHSKDEDDKTEGEQMTSVQWSTKAVEYQEEQRKQGRYIDIATAVNEVKQQAE